MAPRSEIVSVEESGLILNLDLLPERRSFKRRVGENVDSVTGSWSNKSKPTKFVWLTHFQVKNDGFYTSNRVKPLVDIVRGKSRAQQQGTAIQGRGYAKNSMGELEYVRYEFLA